MKSASLTKLTFAALLALSIPAYCPALEPIIPNLKPEQRALWLPGGACFNAANDQLAENNPGTFSKDYNISINDSILEDHDFGFHDSAESEHSENDFTHFDGGPTLQSDDEMGADNEIRILPPSEEVDFENSDYAPVEVHSMDLL